MQSDVRRIEIVGVAGTGKSTLARAVLARHPDWRIAESIHARAPSHLPYFVHSTPGLVRLFGHAFPRPTSSAWFRSWARATAARWALELDVVVELTAPDHVLFERINERGKRHLAKGS